MPLDRFCTIGFESVFDFRDVVANLGPTRSVQSRDAVTCVSAFGFFVASQGVSKTTLA